MMDTVEAEKSTTETPAAPSCTNCKNMREYFNSKFRAVSETVKSQQLLVVKALEKERAAQAKHNASVLEALAEQRALIEKLQNQHSEEPRHDNFEDPLEMKWVPQCPEFPIHTEQALTELDKGIHPGNRDYFIATLKHLLGQDVNKTITNILAEALMLEFNLDGKMGKGRLRDFTNFYDILLRALPETAEPEKVLRRAFHCVKNRYFKRVSIARSQSRKKKLKTEALSDSD